MNNTIWKYEIKRGYHGCKQTIEIPNVNRPLHIELVGDTAYLWILVDTDEPMSIINIYTAWTGQDVTDMPFNMHIGTVRYASGEVCHYFYDYCKETK